MSENLTRMSALGNDFIVIDAISYECDVSKMIQDKLEILKKDMPFDQILCLLPPKIFTVMCILKYTIRMDHNQRIALMDLDA